MNNYNSAKTGGHTFKFWVDKQTGILLKMAIYNADGKVTYGVETKSIELNKKIPDQVFEMKIPKGYKSEYK